MEYLTMRKAVTAVSTMMLGASLVIIVSVLLISSRQKTVYSPQLGSKAEISSELFASSKQSVEIPPPQKPSIGVIHTPALPVKPNEGESLQSDNASAKKTEEHPVAHLPPPASQVVAGRATAPQIDEKPQNLTHPKPIEEKSLPRYGPVCLLVLGAGAFSPGVAKPEAKAQAAIENIIPLIQERSADKVIIEGHADKSIPEGFNPQQARKWNKIVSMLRAKAVAKVLKQKGIAADRIIVRGLGDTAPLVSNQTRMGRSKNRRVEIKLLPARREAGH